jgi:hypothetical protein
MHRQLRQNAALLALVAMLLRAAIPAGWMPDSGAGAPLAFCTADGLVLVQAGAADHGSSPDDHDTLICPFAASAGVGAVPTIALQAAEDFSPGMARPATQPAPFQTPVPPGSRLTRAPPA